MSAVGGILTRGCRRTICPQSPSTAEARMSTKRSRSTKTSTRARTFTSASPPPTDSHGGTAPSATTTSSRWHIRCRRESMGHHWPTRHLHPRLDTTPGIVLDIDTRDAIAMPPNVPVMYPSGRPFEFNAAPGTQHMIRFDGTYYSRTSPQPSSAQSPVRCSSETSPTRNNSSASDR